MREHNIQHGHNHHLPPPPAVFASYPTMGVSTRWQLVVPFMFWLTYAFSNLRHHATPVSATIHRCPTIGHIALERSIMPCWYQAEGLVVSWERSTKRAPCPLPRKLFEPTSMFEPSGGVW